MQNSKSGASSDCSEIRELTSEEGRKGTREGNHVCSTFVDSDRNNFIFQGELLDFKQTNAREEFMLMILNLAEMKNNN